MVISTVLEEDAGEDEWQVPVAMAEEELESGSESDLDAAPPVHPVPTMQGAFEESMAETMNDDEPEVPDRYSKADSVTRRKMLLEQQEYERTVAGRWKQKPGEKFHPLWKLVAQISFGMHLLQQGLAKSDEEVLKILQTHVDEVDGFLERTTEDFDLAQGDINERIRYLKLPLEHGDVFDQMLANRDFRVAIVEGNEKIEHIIDRTAAAMNDALKDVQKGLDATRELAKYMTRVDKEWDDRTEEHDSVYLAMIGNTEGWTRAFLTLQSKGGHLRKALVQLGSIVAEMQRRAGAASRKNLVPSRSVNGRYQVQDRAQSPQDTASSPRSPTKPLPTAPEKTSRNASSQKHSKGPSSRSPVPHQDQSSNGHAKQPRRKDHGQTPRSPNTTKVSKSPEPMSVPRDLERGVSSKTSQNLRSARSPEPPRSGHSPESSRPGQSVEAGSHGRIQEPETARRVRSPEPERSHQVRSPEPERPRQVISPEPERRRQLRSPEPARQGPSPEPAHEVYGIHAREQAQRATSEDSTSRPFKTPAEIMARMRAEQTLKPPVPERSASRKSLSERTLSFLRRKPSYEKPQKDDDASSTNLPIQAHSAKGTPGKTSPSRSPASPPVRRMSSRKAKALSMSTYSNSPTSPDRSGDSPVNREASPFHTRGGKPVPTQSTYAQYSLLPMQPMSPLQQSFQISDDTKSQPTDSPVKPSPPPINPILKTTAALDDSEGNVNTNHPLLQKARHTRFAKNAGGDLPLRHYNSHGALTQSNPDLTQRQLDEMVPPKRSSSLLYNPNGGSFVPQPVQQPRSQTPQERGVSQATDRSYTTGDDRASSQATNRSYERAGAGSQATNRSFTPNSGPIDRSQLSLITRAHTAPSEAELGIHPAHRTPEPPEPASASTVASSPEPSESSTTEHNATPPPIATTRSPPSKSRAASPPSRFAPGQQLRDDAEPKTQDHWQPSHKPTGSNSSNNPLVSTHPKYKTSAQTNTPFYLNPASSSALVDFLASTPPPSPPHPGVRTDRPISPAASHNSAALFNRSFVGTSHYPKDGESSPPPPGPGGTRSMTNLGRHDEEAKKRGWKKVFGGGKGGSSRKHGSADGAGLGPLKQGKKKRSKFEGDVGMRVNGMRDGQAVNGVGEGGGAGGVQTETGFVGMGKDGVWISRKNFVKT